MKKHKRGQYKRDLPRRAAEEIEGRREKSANVSSPGSEEKDGASHWAKLESMPIQINPSDSPRIRTAVMDIAKEKKEGESLFESEQRYRSLYNDTPVMLHSIDHEGLIISASDYWLDTLGYEREEVIGRKLVTFFTEESRDFAERVALPEFFKTGFVKDISYRMIKKNGETMDVLLSAIAERDSAGNVIRSLAVLMDVTERKRAENELNELNQAILEQNDWIVSINRIVTNLGKTLTLPEAVAVMISALKEDMDITRFLLAVKMENGDLECVRNEGFPQSSKAIHNAMMEDAACQVVLDRRRKLGKADFEGRFSCLDDYFPNWAIWPLKGKKDVLGFLIVDENDPKKSDNLGTFLNQAIPFFENVMLYEDMARVNETLAQEVKSRKKVEEALKYAHNGLEQRVEERTAELREANVQLLKEIEERKAAVDAKRVVEQELEKQRVLSIHRDRLLSLGEMAAGIAHELNQPLAGVRGLAEHILIGMDRKWDFPEERIREKLNLIVQQADRMSHIIEHVRIFAREAGKPEVRSVNVNEVVKSGVDMLGAQFKVHGMELECDFSGNLPLVRANPFSLEEVVLNLMTNARDAVEERLEKASASSASLSILLRTLLDGEGGDQRVKIQVVDRGVGISREVLARVFDPFFTTKEPDKGTGLGLSISKSIVAEFGGGLEIQSTPGEGTTVTVSLPVGY